MFAITLDSEMRIESATYPKYAAEGDVLVETLPDGDIRDYLYIDGKYIYDPLPEKEEKTEPTRLDNLEADVEELNEALTMILEGATE